ncbi:uncharacterized protein Tco025E_05484 [Trypanosoma conorhini]|uniref:MYND-type domain-containing protein n=1 Tax=Trypanosoma conorhini TaxID=83891 RepID=A0A422PCY1_9TRYP|nr:uncharacterized protein Tco025E_05484 [Trypanosoma conorhini]RNF15564.1 hypothetical protein Tco025E_05484 [Trypanosoma conorhini]
MSVAEGFLRHGEACTRTGDLGVCVTERYARWELLVVFRRQWSRDVRSNRLYAPVFHLLFASPSSGTEGEIITAADDDPWHLLMYDLTHTCRGVMWESKGAEFVSDILQAVPPALHPDCFSVVCVTVGNTHDRLGLFSEHAFEQYKDRVGRLRLPRTSQGVSVRLHRLTIDRTGAVNGGGGRLPAFVEEAIEWARRRTKEAVDVSAPSQEGNDAILAALPRLNRLLYTATFQGPDDNLVGDGAGCVGEGGRRRATSKLLEERRVALRNLKMRVGNVASFTLAPPTSAEEPGQRWYVLLVQRLYAEKEEVSIDNLDPGPLEPQPIGAELHLMRDGGEVLYLQSQLCDEKSLNTVYGDMMHEDGELFAQLTPLEGIAFDDIDRYLEFLLAQSPPLAIKTPTEPLCKGSCSGYTFPKVVFRRPTGSVVKDTLIASPHLEIVEESPRSPEEWEAARRVFLFLSDHIAPVCSTSDLGGCGGYTLTRDVTPVPAPLHDHKCSWCGRRRDKLLRCGGCKVDMYCCKKHQIMDWKGGHKKSCGLWQKAREDYEKRVTPLLQSCPTERLETPSASAAVTLLQFLMASCCAMPTSAVPVVHIVGVDDDVAGFISELAHRVKRISARWKQLRLLLSSDAFGDEEHNAVYAIAEGGDVTRTAPTSVLGDVWHTQSSSDEAALGASVLVRLYNAKYHQFIGRDAEVSGGAPSAVVSFGNPSGAGMSYLTAAAEVFADRFVGVVPVLCTEPTLVGAHHTFDTIVARVQGSNVMNADLKKRVLEGLSLADNFVRLNVQGMGHNSLDLYAAAGRAGETSNANAAVPETKPASTRLHPNLYYFIIPAEPTKS